MFVLPAYFRIRGLRADKFFQKHDLPFLPFDLRLLFFDGVDQDDGNLLVFDALGFALAVLECEQGSISATSSPIRPMSGRSLYFQLNVTDRGTPTSAPSRE
jgi:hypothetical protein